MNSLIDEKYKNLGGIYIIKNSIDNRVYIGKTVNFKNRMSDHKSRLLKNKHTTIKLQRFVNKYGINALYFGVLEVVNDCKTNDILDKEIEYIKKYNSVKNGFNSILDMRSVDQFKIKTKDGLIFPKWSEERKLNYSNHIKEFLKNNPEKRRGSNNGRSKITEETAKQIKLDILNKLKRSLIIEKYNIPLSTYKHIQSGSTWGYIKI
jgi:group I intron endonuclease